MRVNVATCMVLQNGICVGDAISVFMGLPLSRMLSRRWAYRPSVQV